LARFLLGMQDPCQYGLARFLLGAFSISRYPYLGPVADRPPGGPTNPQFSKHPERYIFCKIFIFFAKIARTGNTNYYIGLTLPCLPCHFWHIKTKPLGYIVKSKTKPKGAVCTRRHRRQGLLDYFYFFFFFFFLK